MNDTLYTDLAPLGFAEWLEKNDICNDEREIIESDKPDIDSWERTVWNALAFRWLREEKKISCHIDFNRTNEWYFRIDSIKENEYLYHCSDDDLIYDTHELAEHHALNKALEIIKGGENGI